MRDTGIYIDFQPHHRVCSRANARAGARATMAMPTSLSKSRLSCSPGRQLGRPQKPLGKPLLCCCQAAGRSSISTVPAQSQPAPAKGPAQQIHPHSQQQQQRKLQRHELLQDPAKIGARGTATVMVPDAVSPVSLATYMQLPVEQYYILDPSQIQLLSGSTFILSVPRINLLGASLQPVIEVQVTSEQDAVILSATDCQLNATGIMGGLDERFALQFTTRLTWKSPQHQHEHLQHFQQQQQQQQHQREVSMLAAEQQQLSAQQQQQKHSSNGHTGGNGASAGSSIRAGWDRLRNVNWSGNGSSSSSKATAGRQQQHPEGDAVRGSITGSAVVNVWCEVIPPFNLMPREVLVGTCNSVLSGLVNSLLPWFTRQLAADYQKWAADERYRAARAARSKQQAKQQQ